MISACNPKRAKPKRTIIPLSTSGTTVVVVNTPPPPCVPFFGSSFREAFCDLDFPFLVPFESEESDESDELLGWGVAAEPAEVPAGGDDLGVPSVSEVSAA